MVVISKARDQDAEAAITVVRKSIEELCVDDHRNDPGTLGRWLANKTPAMFREWLANPGNFCVVAKEDEVLVGIGLIDRYGELKLFYLVPGKQRRGIGKLIFRSLEDKAREWGLQRLFLGSTAGARCFYEALGFRAEGPARLQFGRLKSYPYSKLILPPDPC